MAEVNGIVAARPAARGLHRRAHPARRHRHRRRSRTSTPSATASRCGARTTSCSTTSGGFYFTDLGKSRARDVDKGGVYYATADGSSIKNVVYGLDHANGIALSPDGSALYVAETITGRLWSWEIESPGVVKPRTTPYGPGTLLYNFDGFQLLDSMAVDSDGNICVATLVTGAVSVVEPEGQAARPVHGARARRRSSPTSASAAPTTRTAYITSSGRGLLY